jgi:methionyl-tRNA synthetase
LSCLQTEIAGPGEQIMNNNSEARIITAALPFANNIPHLGNIVGSHLPADIFARYCRLQGYRTIFVGGTDEHGTASELAAYQKGISPQELCDELYERHVDIYNWFGISYDNFSRTSREIHRQIAQDFCRHLYDKGLIVEAYLKVPFCLDCEKGLADRLIFGTCPHCKYEFANGDQCDKCGTTLEAYELLLPSCATCSGRKVEFRKTKHLFLDLQSVLPQVENWLETNKQLRRQVKRLAGGWLKQGIKPRCITRDLKWGIPVPVDGYENKVLYVWFENVIGYISALVELLGQEGKELWKDSNSKVYHFLGKDNIPFHTIYWPGELIGIGGYVLPYNIVGLQYLTVEGEKFSKSRRVGIFSDDVIHSGIPADYWRFYLTYLIPETKDTNFVVANFKERVNKELVGNYGNLIYRTLSIIWNKLGGKVPVWTEQDEELEQQVAARVSEIVKCYENCELRQALLEILRLCDLGNRYLNDAAPWKTADWNSVAYVLELGRICTVLLYPIIPNLSGQVEGLLNSSEKSLHLLCNSRQISEPKPIFKRVEEDALALLPQ